MMTVASLFGVAPRRQRSRALFPSAVLPFAGTMASAALIPVTDQNRASIRLNLIWLRVREYSLAL